MLDKIDKAILSQLQVDSSLSIHDLAESINLTISPCWKRIKKLETLGVIEKRVALLDPNTLGLSFTAFVMVKTEDHSHSWYQSFVGTVVDYPEVMEFYRMAGEYDYMLKVLVKDMKEFDLFYKKLVCGVDSLTTVTSTFAMEPLKYTTALPIE